MAERNSIVEIIKQHLNAMNVSPAIIEDAPILARRALIKLQSKQILPPKSMEFLSETKKEEKRDKNGNVMYYFYRLPEDFKTLHEFYVKDSSSSNPTAVVPYVYTRYDNYMDNLQNQVDSTSTETAVKYFTITDLNEEGENNKKVLIAVPFPDDGTHIEIKYFPDGSITTLDYLTPRYWEAVLEQVEIILKIKSSMDEEETLREVSAQKNQKGVNDINNANTTRVVNKIFGGRTGSTYQQIRRRR